MRMPLRTKRSKAEEVLRKVPYAPPYRGLNTRDPESAMRQGYATILENFWPDGLRLQSRLGSANHVTGFANSVKTLAPWNGPAGSSKLFAFTDAGGYDATAAGAVGASVTTVTNGWLQHLNFRTSAATYLILVNGTDSLRHYNGAAWATVASYTINGGGTLTTTDIVALNAHARRLWFAKKDTADAYYLDVDSIGGNVTLFPLGAQFSDGGYLQAMGTWTIDGGSGSEDLCVFVSSKGQISVYAGTDPTDTTKWLLKGVYKLAAPLGRKCLTKLGGDLIVLTEGGAFSLTALVSGKADSASVGLTDLIRPSITAAAKLYSANKGWEMAQLPTQNLLLINVPTQETLRGYQFAMNTTTKAWTVFRRMDATCWAEMGSQLYFASDKTVLKGWSGFDDNGKAIDCKARGAFDNLGSQLVKQVPLMRPVMVIEGRSSVDMALDVDYRFGTDYKAAPFKNAYGDLWDVDLFDTAVWSARNMTVLEWGTAAAWPGVMFAVRLRCFASGGRVAWTAMDLMYQAARSF